METLLKMNPSLQSPATPNGKAEKCPDYLCTQIFLDFTYRLEGKH